MDSHSQLASPKLPLLVVIVAVTLIGPSPVLPAEIRIESARIIGGVSTTISEFPYQVSLRYNNQHICGGSIISPSHILTAAHCIVSTNAGAFSVLAGSSTTSRSTSGPGQLRSVSRLNVHPQYSSTTNRNDIAVLVLASPLTFDGASVGSIALPDPSIRIMAGDELVITGWGRTTEGGLGSPVLRKATVPAVALAQCRSVYGSGSIADTMICAGQGGKDTCQGDSGGPLATGTGSASGGAPTTLVGVTSFGYGCGRPNYPGVYTRVSSFRTFIRTYAGI